MLQKLIHKKWMILSLLIGNILLISIAVSHPMYKNASLDRMLLDEFTQFLEENNTYPGMITIEGKIRKKEGIDSYYKAKDVADNLSNTLGLTLINKISDLKVVESKANSLMNRDDSKEKKISLASISNMEEHITLLSGTMYSNEILENGMIEAIVSQSALVNLNLIVGEEFAFPHQRDGKGEPLQVKIVGVYENSLDDDVYWVNSPDYYNKHFMIAENIFRDLFMQETNRRFNVDENWYIIIDYTQITPGMVDTIITQTKAYEEGVKTAYSKMITPDYVELLKNFQGKEKKISVALNILQVPVMVLLCAFLFMISRQMLEMEQNEISLLKSRGASKGQIFRLYFMQATFLALIGLAVGLVLGSYFCQILGSARAFLEFVQRRSLKITYDREVFLYGITAAVVSICMTILPVLKLSNITIVHLKRKKSRRRKPLWQKLYIDFILFGISLYGLYSFRRQEEEMVNQVVSGGSLDPLLFLSSSLFILGAGLITLRIQPILVKIIYYVGRKRWKPAKYASFLQIIRTGNKQYFIMTFLVLTVSLGIFNTTVARTILSNSEKNAEYRAGADLVIQEVWPSNELLVKMDPTIPLTYKEPDFGKYGQLEGVSGIAKVYVNENANIKLGKEKPLVTLMGIHTKDFGKTAFFPEGLLPYHFYEYLNSMSTNANAIIVSSNFRDKLEYRIGDTLLYYNENQESIAGVIYGFVDYWPTYRPTEVMVYTDGTTGLKDNYLVVAHLTTIQEMFGVTPYEIWLDMDGPSDLFYNFVEENQIMLSKFVDLSSEYIKLQNDTLFQGTNGILTMSFIIILILCGAGYLIYWILSIKSRELLFGIFRAMGMSKREILHMLFTEQVYSGFLYILFGTGIGLVAAKLFVPMIQIAYSASDQVLPLTLITKSSDLIRLFAVIGFVILLCFIILTRLVFRMKINQALKLGED